jgi:hypothetical protein
MSQLGIEDIDELLDTLAEAKRQIEAQRVDPIDVTNLYHLSTVVLEILGYSNTAYVENSLGINSSLLSKFVKMRGTIHRQQALMVAERIRTYLKSENNGKDYIEVETAVLPTTVTPPLKDVVFVQAEAWSFVPDEPTIKDKIGDVSKLLDSIIRQVRSSNLPVEEQALTEIERQQLIAILETALNLLRSPIVEKGMIKKAGELLTKSAKQATEKQVQEGVGRLMGVGAKLLLELGKSLFN